MVLPSTVVPAFTTDGMLGNSTIVLEAGVRTHSQQPQAVRVPASTCRDVLLFIVSQGSAPAATAGGDK